MLTLLIALFVVSSLLSAVWLVTRGETVVWTSPLVSSALQVRAHAPRRGAIARRPLRDAQQPT